MKEVWSGVPWFIGWPRKKADDLLTADEEIRQAVDELIAEVSAEPIAIAA